MNPKDDAPLAPLQVGDRYQTALRYAQEEVERFAELTGDRNPVHLDADYAAKTRFKRPIVHGMLSATVFSKVFGMEFPGEGTIYLKQSLVFKRPVLVETDYEARFEVTALDTERHTATISTEVVDVASGKAVLAGEATVMHEQRVA